MMSQRFFLTCLWLLCYIGGYSQERSYSFSHLTIDQGLSNNQVTAILRDRKGFLWVGTMSGLNRYDGYSFNVFTYNELDSTSLPANSISKLYEDAKGRIWVFTTAGLCVYDPVSDRFTRTIDPILKAFSLPAGSINDIRNDQAGNYWFLYADGLYRYSPRTRKTVLIKPQSGQTMSDFLQDANGDLWIIYRNGLFTKLDRNSFQVQYTNTQLAERTRNERYRFKRDQESNLWIYASSTNNGVYQFSEADQSLTHIDKKSRPLRLNNDIIRDLEIGDNGRIWIATDHGGLNIIDKKNGTVTYSLNDPDNGRSLAQNSVNTLHKDHENTMWVGTFKRGVDYYNPDVNRFTLYQHSPLKPASLPTNDINRFAEDATGNIWVGTNGGGLLYFDRHANTFKRYVNNPANTNSLSSDVIVSMTVDHQNKLWIGTYFGGLDYFDGRQFRHFQHDPANANSLSANSIWDVLEDSAHTIWIATLNKGLDRYNPATGQFTNFQHLRGVYSGYVTALLEDRQGNIWAGTGYGLSVLRKGKANFDHILASKSPGSLSNNNILSLCQDSRGLLWVGTQDGLNAYDPKTNRFTVFREKDGLIDNNILTITEDGYKKLWVTTTKGISYLSVEPSAQSLQVRVINYDESDGLQGKQFNKGAAFRTRSGDLLFGGVNGFNLINPSTIRINTSKPPVVLVNLQVNNSTVRTGQEVNGKVILPQSISETKLITLGPDENAFSIQFAALSFFHSLKNRYRYKLDGFNKNWVDTQGNNRTATYTNLDPGDYEFRVMAANSDGVWNEEGARVTIRILPPFWKSTAANILYCLLVIGGFWAGRRFIQQRERMKYKAQHERETSLRLHELDLLKIKFLTNVSHEFRTPLSLILTPIESYIKQPSATVSLEKGQLQLIHRNAKRLLNLVNQLLDFRQMEVQEVRLNLSEGDIVKFIREVSLSFSVLWESKHIQFTFMSWTDSFETMFDENKVERILFNLISNAFKFTPEGGTVVVSVDLDTTVDPNQLIIQVRDSGIGIAPANQPKIFDRFFQADLPASVVNEGSGIGLAITNEFVKLHGGTINVESDGLHGSCFTVALPVVDLTMAPKPALTPSPEELTTANWTAPTDSPVDRQSGKPILLLVEDNDDFRQYLRDNLRERYQIEEAKDGQEGWEKAMAVMPDMIVSDLMMPKVDGTTLCRQIRTDQRTSHIPFIMLTAKSSEEQRLAGLEMGADDYITKPFSFELLQVRIKNLIDRRAQQHSTFQRTINIKASDISITSLDEKLIEKAILLVEKNMANADFSVEELSNDLGMSRAHLYRKLLSLTGKSPVEFIRIIRLSRAAQLLEKSQLTVSEVAYEVGFNNPKYFAKYFKEHFNVLPSQYAASRNPQHSA
ncbi:two-component regulator propeller domain-containing protein [uncultured Fibrella sp.]|uniref:hybrid sensor histidine kinase/response regulator transcription factor n=1 Tax=uncultured Fibrella sp. TaxID=1284596 RepID=UPI0035CB12A7